MSEEGPQPPAQAQQAATGTTDGATRVPEGATREVLRDGNGKDIPQPGDTVIMHYVGTLLDGTEFDSSRERGTPFRTLIGCGKVIKAWDCLVLEMSVGELAKFTCPPETAYGNHGFPGKIPPNSTICFEVELCGIERETPAATSAWNRLAQLHGKQFPSPN